MIPLLSRLSYCDRLKSCKLTTLHYRRIRGDMIETYKIMTKKYDASLCPDFIISNMHRTRGNELLIQKSRFK